jgi:hypothetical protein
LSRSLRQGFDPISPSSTASPCGVERAGELAGSVVDEEPEVVGQVAEVHK